MRHHRFTLAEVDEGRQYFGHRGLILGLVGLKLFVRDGKWLEGESDI
jgi:hypothetical protein